MLCNMTDTLGKRLNRKDFLQIHLETLRFELFSVSPNIIGPIGIL